MSAGPDGTDDDLPDLPPADDVAGGSQVRARDLLAVKTREELEALEAELAPQEIADLASWFALPSAEVAAERAAAAPAVSRRVDPAFKGMEAFGSDELLDREYEERQKRIAEASLHITDQAIALLERHRDTAATFLRELVPPAPIIDERILRVRVPSEEEMGSIGELREYSRDEVTEDNLREAVPQAVLRDLYRPVASFEISFTNPFFEDGPPPDPWIDLRLALREPVVQPLPPPFVVHELFAEARREFRDLIGGSWADKVAEIKAYRDKYERLG